MMTVPAGTPKKRSLAEATSNGASLDAQGEERAFLFNDGRKYFTSDLPADDSVCHRFRGGTSSWGSGGAGYNEDGDATETPKRMCLATPSSISRAMVAVPESLRPESSDRLDQEAATGSRKATVEAPGTREIGVKRSFPRESCPEEDSGDVDISLQPLALVERHLGSSRCGTAAWGGNGDRSEQTLCAPDKKSQLPFPSSSVSSVDAAIESIIRKHRRTVLESPRGGSQCVQLQLVPLGPDPLLDLRFLGAPASSRPKEDAATPLSSAAASPVFRHDSCSAANFSESSSTATLSGDIAPLRASQEGASKSTSRNEMFYSGDVSHAGWVLDVMGEDSGGDMELCEA
jgi:hypothetical protein